MIKNPPQKAQTFRPIGFNCQLSVPVTNHSFGLYNCWFTRWQVTLLLPSAIVVVERLCKPPGQTPPWADIPWADTQPGKSPPEADTSLDDTPTPWTDTSWTDTPPGQTPPGQTTSQANPTLERTPRWMTPQLPGQTPTGQSLPWADTTWEDTPPGQTPPWTDNTWVDTPSGQMPIRADTPLGRQSPLPPQTATAADGTYPTGMHSCLYLFKVCTMCTCSQQLQRKIVQKMHRIIQQKNVYFLPPLLSLILAVFVKKVMCRIHAVNPKTLFFKKNGWTACIGQIFWG